MLKQFKSTSLADQVFDRLENDIIQGVYPKGEILTELKLVEQLGVSRTPIGRPCGGWNRNGSSRTPERVPRSWASPKATCWTS